MDTYIARARDAVWKVATIVWITLDKNASRALKDVGRAHGGTIWELTIIGRISVHKETRLC